MAALVESETQEGSLSDWEGGRDINEEVRIIFADPEEGTPAFNAIEANRQHTVTQIDKHVKRHMKRPKKKHIIGSTKKESRKDRPNIKGKVIDGEHEQYLLTMGMMMGIRVSVNGSQDQKLIVRDFDKVDKLVFPPGGSKRTPPHKLQHTFKFKDYAPKAFAALRKLNRVDSASYMQSVCGDFNFIQFISNAKSGQFFFYTHDGQYMIKTQTNQENRFLRRILPHYYRHMAANPDSTICRFYGMHRVKMYHLRRKLHFVVMRSVVDTACKIHTMYDLKGSLVGRRASQKDRETGGVLKDNDLIEDKQKFHLGQKRSELLIQQLEADSNFLAELKIMDYSLLVGIHDRSLRVSLTENSVAGEDSFMEGGSTSVVAEAGGGGGDSARKDAAAAAALSNTEDEETKSTPATVATDEAGKLQEPERKSEVVEADTAVAAKKKRNSAPQPRKMVSTKDGAATKAAEQRRGRNSDPNIVKHSNTPLVRDRSRQRTHSPANVRPAHQVPASPEKPPPVETHPQSSGDESGAAAQVTDEDYESDFDDEESSDSDDESGGLGSWVSPWGKPAKNDHGLPAKPIGEPDDEVAVPVHPEMGSISHRRDGGIGSRNKDGGKGDEIYFLGIIDILQQYNSTKRAETFFKSFGNDVSEISCVPPDVYAQRFVKFIKKATEEIE